MFRSSGFQRFRRPSFLNLLNLTKPSKPMKAHRAFTLIEVNLAMLIMAGGVLSIVGLYSFGFRENRQSREDVAATTLADSVISPLVMAISATNLKWSIFRQEKNFPSARAWGDYINNSRGVVTQDPENRAEGVYSSTMSWISGAAKGPLNVKTAFPSAALNGTGMSCGLVVQHDQDSAVVRIAFRATRLPGELLAMPLFYTEVRFQGLPDE